MISKRYNSISILYKRAPAHLQNISSNITENKNHVKSLCKYLNINENKAQYLTMKHPVITKLNEEKIKSLVDTLNDIGLSEDALIKEPTLFAVLPVSLRFRFKVLRECGIENITPTLLATYFALLKQKTIGQLKKSSLIPPHINVENRLASYMSQWPTSLTTLIHEDVNNTTLFLLRLKIIQRYLELVLDLTEDEFIRGIETYPTVKHRPLESINETLKLLQLKISISNNKIKSNFYLIQANPENLKNILYNMRSIAGIDINEVIRMHPKIALRNSHSLLQIKQILEEYGISNEAQKRCFDIYTLGPDTVRERLEKAKNTPEFNMFYSHPRFLKMIHYKKVAMKRLSKLYENNKKCVSLNILSGCSAHYEVFEKAPGDRLGKGKDLLFCISQSLGKRFNTTQIKKVIRRHPFWINIPVLQVKYVYEQLSKQFSDSEIFENCLILLYPWKKVRETLNLFGKKPLHMFSDNFNYDNLSNSQKLSLVLYIIEKNHYFSGNGVWSEERNKTCDNMPINENESKE